MLVITRILYPPSPFGLLALRARRRPFDIYLYENLYAPRQARDKKI